MNRVIIKFAQNNWFLKPFIRYRVRIHTLKWLKRVFLYDLEIKRMNKLWIKHIFLTAVFFCIVMLSKAQDPVFSQFYANPLYLNPALTGATFEPRLTMNYRNQWPSLNVNFVTYSVSYDQYVENINSSFGFMINSDRTGQGVLTASTFNGFYSYTLQVSKDLYVNAGIEASVWQRKLDWDLLDFGDEIDPIRGFVFPTNEIPPEENSISFFDFSAGLAFGYKDIFYGGFAMSHLTEPYDGFYSDRSSRLYRKFTVHGGAVIDLESRRRAWRAYDAVTISPNIMYTQQLDFKQLNLGIYLNKYPFVVGGWFRHNIVNPDAFIMLIGFTYNKFRFGYSYDITVSKMANATGGAHEISMSFRFRNPKVRKKRPDAIPCPSF